MCSTIVEEVEFGAIAIVKNPFDKFGVLQFDGMDYDYSDVGMLFSKLNSPFQYWKLEEETIIREEFKSIERNDICPCGSNKKYKKCCMNSDARLSKHMKVQVLYSGL
ncbi:YecA family protein [Providencia sp. NPDC089923]|uniref:YecA family protein n=1 Tax=Providencia sp. NPDC089923 TaxID=3415004 RepID=UPI003C30B530